MGIPGLWQDFSQWAKPVKLCLDSEQGDTVNVSRVVIDGPSLAYRIHHEVVQAREDAELPPSHRMRYSSYNSAVLDFLERLQDAGVVIERIIFDGALPLRKRGTRLSRLQQSQTRLQTFLRTKQNAPPLPFLVPSMIETLLLSKHAAIVEVVPGEADPYCAAITAEKRCAILSADSDMLLYDLAAPGCLVMLNDLNLETLQGTCVVQSYLRKMLRTDNLLHWASARLKSPQSTMLQLRAELADAPVPTYKELCDLTKEFVAALIEARNVPKRPFLNMDPRLSELVNQMIMPKFGHGERHMYFPQVIEDLSHDAAWTYGIKIRQIAYTILTNLSTSQPEPIMEFYRRGPRVVASRVEILDKEALDTALKDTIVDIFQTARMSDRPEPRTFWRMLGMWKYREQCHSTGRYLYPKASAVRVLIDEVTEADMHIHACLQCMLYSFRILKQTFEYVEYKHDKWHQESAEALHLLETMPALELLFDQRDKPSTEWKDNQKYILFRTNHWPDEGTLKTPPWQNAYVPPQTPDPESQDHAASAQAACLDPNNPFSALEVD